MFNAGLKPSACDAERERLREVAKYYCIVDPPSPVDNDIQKLQGHDRPHGTTHVSSDTALTALAQLGVLRFGCNRAFVSIIDEANQHVIAEATASLVLGNGKEHSDNTLYLGTRSLDLGWGVVPHTVRSFTNRNPTTAATDNLVANSTRYIVNDFTREDAYKDRPYVVDWPSMRFYAAVPIKSPGDFVLGSYTIVDDKPRSDFGDAEVEYMQGIADAIAQHLETVRLSHCHRRTETLVKSLTTFVKHHNEFDPTELYTTTGAQPSLNTNDGPDGQPSSYAEARENPHLNISGMDGLLNSGPRSPSEATAELSSLFSKTADSEQTEPSLPSRPIDRPTSALSHEPEGRDSLPRSAHTVSDSPPQGLQVSTDIAGSVTKIFARASILLRDSMDLDGVIFVDASRCNAGVILTNDTGTWEPLPSTLNAGFVADPYPSPADVPGVGSLSKAAEKTCTLLGRALRNTVDISESRYDFNTTEKLLEDLMNFFPQGQIFDLSNLDNVDDAVNQEQSFRPSDHTQEICRQLASHFPAANCMIFSPIWDWNKSRWLAGTLVWTSNTFRALGADELHYFKAFGDSIISEVARVDWATTQNSKSAFMSSVSHELRSPLHGILASAELLGATTLPPHEKHLVGMIESCGLTLLDTLNHLLDFSGINNLAALEDSPQSTSEAGTTLETTFDLGDLVEEVVEVQYTGQKLPKAALHLNQPPTSAPEESDAKSEELSVIVRVEDNPTWKIQSVPGAWRRIVMNVLGNSLKWTKAGFVEVSLSKVRGKRDPFNMFALLSVTDTGCGIGPEFLRHKLFSPFSQENALSEGLGLGLSIVRQLVASLDGHLNVRSEAGVGTQVDIFVPVQMLQAPCKMLSTLSLIDEDPSPSPPVRVCLIGFNDYPGLKESPTGILPAEAKRKLAIRSCVTSILVEQGGWNISSSESLNDSEGDVAIIEEAKYLDILKTGQPPLESAQRRGFKRIFIILNSKIPTSVPVSSSHLIRVSQPFGCRKFRDAVTKVHDLLKQRPEDSPTCPFPDIVPASNPPLPDPSPTVPEPTPNTPIVLQRSTSEPVPPLAPTPLEVPPPLHLLIVDDNDINLRILATFAGRIGCTYDTATDGLIALNKYKDTRRTYDLILMDISMPVMDGIVATNEIRQFEEEKGLARSRIMAVTGVASTDMQQRAKTAGIDEYLVKPVSLTTLKKVIAAL
ncbi:hypothetical protein BJX99DRAFT_157671 [Aspergillus californicus]